MDFAYIMLGSLYVQTTAQLISHFASVQRVLKPGGLYFLDWCIDFSPLTNTSDAWTCRRDGVEVRVRYTTRLLHPARQHYRESLSAEVRGQGAPPPRALQYPPRYLSPRVRLGGITHAPIELVGWWNDWDFNQPSTASPTA